MQQFLKSSFKYLNAKLDAFWECHFWHNTILALIGNSVFLLCCSIQVVIWEHSTSVNNVAVLELCSSKQFTKGLHRI